MTGKEFDELRSPEVAAVIEDLLARNLTPEQSALRSGSSTIATQIKYLQRAVSKLPAFYAVRAVIDRQGFEQCSSQLTAESKFDDVSGALAIDLTAGQGVDSYALSRRFDRVISVELDPLRAQITAHNLALLGADNVEVLTADAESFVVENRELRADLIYVDPSRVELSSAGARKVYSLEQSSPNILRIIDDLRRIAPRVMVKLSPLFDIDECFRLFGSDVSVEVVSLDGECKEVLVRVGFDDRGMIINTILKGERKAQYRYPRSLVVPRLVGESFEPRHLSVADVVFIKSRTLSQYLSGAYPAVKFNVEGYVLSSDPLEGFAGQSFSISRMEAYQPKKIRKILKELGIARATISHHFFPYSSEQIVRDLGLRGSGAAKLFFSVYGGQPTIFFVSS